MPCSDVAETLHLELDGDERLVAYTLRKRTCGAGVGEPALLVRWAQGMSLEALAACTPDSLAGSTSQVLPTLLVLKHTHALAGAARVLLGIDPGTPTDRVALAELVRTESGSLQVEALIESSVAAADVPACGNCSRCGSGVRRSLGPGAPF